MRRSDPSRNGTGKIGAMARPNKQVERRRDIMDAAIALIERDDLATLKLADVAEELGLTTNAVRYYFKDMTQLLSELALRSDVRFYDERLELQTTSSDPREQLALTMAAGLPTGPDDAEWRAIWRAVLSAGFVGSWYFSWAISSFRKVSLPNSSPSDFGFAAVWFALPM